MGGIDFEENIPLSTRIIIPIRVVRVVEGSLAAVVGITNKGEKEVQGEVTLLHQVERRGIVDTKKTILRDIVQQILMVEQEGGEKEEAVAEEDLMNIQVRIVVIMMADDDRIGMIMRIMNDEEQAVEEAEEVENLDLHHVPFLVLDPFREPTSHLLLVVNLVLDPRRKRDTKVGTVVDTVGNDPGADPKVRHIKDILRMVDLLDVEKD
jgi:hypothetical protein